MSEIDWPKKGINYSPAMEDYIILVLIGGTKLKGQSYMQGTVQEVFRWKFLKNPIVSKIKVNINYLLFFLLFDRPSSRLAMPPMFSIKSKNAINSCGSISSMSRS